MKVWYDCEFIDKGRLMPIQLVSIGCVREDGAEWYGINDECLSNVVRDPWMAMNVAPHLPIHADPGQIWEWDQEHPEYQHVMNFDQLTAGLLRFLTEHPFLQLWADYAAYDHVIMTQIFGTMIELPSGIPMWTHDLQQLVENDPAVALPPAPERNHHALEDARWCKAAYDVLLRMEPHETQPRPSSLSQQPRMHGKDIVDAQLL